jgi:hypothetical protein
VKKDYLSEKAAKKKTTKEAMLVLLVFIILFIVIMVRFALRPDSRDNLFSSMPTGSEAYEIAKDYIKPTLKLPDVEFADEEYQYAKGADSVYVVKSYFETKDISNRKIITNFTIRIKYNGGTTLNEVNWSLISLEENK